jgi:hypothetical protein
LKLSVRVLLGMPMASTLAMDMEPMPTAMLVAAALAVVVPL